MLMTSEVTTTIGIYLFPKVEVLDFAGPYEVFTTAARVAGRRNPDAPPLFAVFTVAATIEPVPAGAGLRVIPDFAIAAHPPIDVLIVPGGVVTAELARPRVLEWVRMTAQQAAVTASVCTGAFILAQAGVVTTQSVTTHWEDLADLQTAFPLLRVVGGVRWVDEGRVVTAAGISAGIDMSLHLVARIAGRELAEVTARQMEFDWRQDF